MDGLRIEPVDGERMMLDWQYVHNTIIPTAPLTLDEVRERTGRRHLEVAYIGDVVVGGLERAREFADERPIETVVLASNEDGLAFAGKHGFVEVERYLLPGDTIPFVSLRLDD